MNHRNGTDETSNAEPKCWKRCDAIGKKQNTEKQQYITDKLISGPQAGRMNMKYHPDAFTHEENIYDSEDEKVAALIAAASPEANLAEAEEQSRRSAIQFRGRTERGPNRSGRKILCE